MNENPEGTPNPLNPNPGVEGTPEAPINESSQKILEEAPEASVSESSQEISEELVAPLESTTQIESSQRPANKPLTMDAVVTESMINESVSKPSEPVQSAQSIQSSQEYNESQPVAKDSVVEPAKKPKKKGAFIFAVILSLIAIGCAVAAILMVTVFDKKQNAVPAAISKLMSGNIPQYAIMNGSIKVESDSSFVDSLEITFSSNINNTSGENTTSAEVEAKLANGLDFSFNAEEVHTKDGDFYMKLSGVDDALNNYALFGSSQLLTQEIECTDEYDDENMLEECDTTTQLSDSDSGKDLISVLDSIGLFEVIDDEWIRIPGSDFSNISDLGIFEGPAKCLVGAAGELKEYGNNFAAIYESNPFIEYSTDNLKVTKKKDDLYHLSINANKFTNFVNAMTNNGFANEMLACTDDYATNDGIDEEVITEILNILPQIYVEINEDNNFTRIYLSGKNEDGSYTTTADLSFSYPTAIVVTAEEPEEYLDYTVVLDTVLSKFFGVDTLE